MLHVFYVFFLHNNESEYLSVIDSLDRIRYILGGGFIWKLNYVKVTDFL